MKKCLPYFLVTSYFFGGLLGTAPPRPVPAAGRASRAAPAAGSVAGPLPPVPSSTGRVYYAFERRHGGPSVVAGYELAVLLLGGSLGSRGLAPHGFRTVEDAVNHMWGIPSLRRYLELDRRRAWMHRLFVVFVMEL